MTRLSGCISHAFGGFETTTGHQFILVGNVKPRTVSVLPPPRIDAPLEGIERPLFSVMIPAFNSAELLKKTLQSVLCQDPGIQEMEIEVVDNCSTKDNLEKVVREIGGDRVKYFRQPTNVGAIENFNTCIRRARGHWVHILHADDVVRPGFYGRAKEAITAHPQVSAFMSRIVYINENGTWLELSELEADMPKILGDEFVVRQFTNQRIQFVCMIVRREAYAKLGGFRAELRHCSDWDMWNRLLVNGGVFYTPELLACFRIHPGADTESLVRTGENVADERRCIRISCSLLPPDRARAVYRMAMRAATVRALRRTRRLWKQGDRQCSYQQMRMGLRCALSFSVHAFLPLWVSLNRP